MKEPLPPPAQEWAELLRHRGLHTPALIFLATHRPLAFWAGQLLLLCEPLGFVAPGFHLAQWGSLLSHPRGPETLAQLLCEDE